MRFFFYTLRNYALHFISFDYLCGVALDLGHFFLQGCYPLVDRPMPKAQDPANRPKIQPFSIQVQRHLALFCGSRIGFMANCVKVLTRFTLQLYYCIVVALSAPHLLTLSALAHRRQSNSSASIKNKEDSLLNTY
jgi:hypothetical protein